MSIAEKLYNKIMEEPPRSDITLNEINKFLIAQGFVLMNTKGSHKSYRHNNHSDVVTIAAHGNGETIKKAYIRNIQRIISEL